MPACESKFVSRCSRKATVAKIVLLGRPRSCSCKPSLVDDCGQVLRVLGWALTRIRSLPSVLNCYTQEISTVVTCGTEPLVDN